MPKADEDGKTPEKKWDILLKIISFLMAVLIWFAVIFFQSNITQRIFTGIEVQIDNFNEMRSHGYTILGNDKFYVDVTLEGKNSDLNRINRSEIRAYIDLQGVERAGEIIRPVQIREINYVAVVEQSLSSAIIYIDRNMTKSVPVTGNIIRSNTESGIETGELSFTPEAVNVTGPEQLIDMINHARVEVDLGSALVERSRNVRENFILVDENGGEVSNPYIRYHENTIEVHVPVYMEKEVPLRVEYRYGYYTRNNVSVKINPEAVRLRGSPDYLNNLDEIIIDMINEKEIDGDRTLRRPVNLPGNPPDDIREINGVTSADVEIIFNDMLTRTVTIPVSRFDITPPDNFGYHIQEANLVIRLFGPANRINISPSLVLISADLSGFMEAGTYPVTVSAVISDEGAPVFCIGEYNITVEIY